MHKIKKHLSSISATKYRQQIQNESWAKLELLNLEEILNPSIFIYVQPKKLENKLFRKIFNCKLLCMRAWEAANWHQTRSVLVFCQKIALNFSHLEVQLQKNESNRNRTKISCRVFNGRLRCSSRRSAVQNRADSQRPSILFRKYGQLGMVCHYCCL